ncbi:hypothetical protein ACFQOZ_20310 [Comamonas endophytica]|uniref:hypothetical protein n=1 Tax=Comamonas endophytica TaxID=2949090 RepID=UPI00362449EF
MNAHHHPQARRRTLAKAVLLSAIAIATLSGPVTAAAQEWQPTRPIRLLVPYGPAAAPTSSRAPWRWRWATPSASRWWSRTSPAGRARSP